MELKPCHRRPLRPDEIGPRVMELSKYLRKNFNAAVAEQGLFSGQQDILLLLIRQPGMTLGQLSRALGGGQRYRLRVCQAHGKGRIY